MFGGPNGTDCDSGLVLVMKVDLAKVLVLLACFIFSKSVWIFKFIIEVII